MQTITGSVGLGGALSAEGVQAGFHTSPNKRLIILPLGPEIQSKTLWLSYPLIGTRMEMALIAE